MVKNKIVAVDQSSKKDGDSITWKDNEWKVIERSLSEIWVSDISGSDDNDGSELNPFKTLTKAVESMLNSTGEVIIHVAPHGSEEGYDTSVFGIQREWKCNKLRIIGDGYDVIEEGLEYKSFSSERGVDPRHYTFLNDGYFTEGEYDGYFLVKTSGPSTVEVGNRRLILKTETDRIYIPQKHYGPSSGVPEVGDVFSVTKPSVKFKINFDEMTPGGWSDNRSSYIYGGSGTTNQSGYDAYMFSSQFNDVVQFDNIEFRIPDGIPELEWSYTNVYFIGAFEFFGCLFTSNLNQDESSISIIFKGISQLGMTTEQDDPDYTQLGDGISVMSRGSGPSPMIELQRSTMVGSIYGSNIILKKGSVYECQYGCSFSDQSGGDFANICMYDGSHFISRSDYAGVFLNKLGTSNNEIFSYESTAWIYAIIFHYGDSNLIKFQYKSIFHVGYASIINKSGIGGALSLWYDSIMRIIHKDYSGMGDLTLGNFYGAMITRPSGAWEVKEEVAAGGNRAFRNA